MDVRFNRLYYLLLQEQSLLAGSRKKKTKIPSVPVVAKKFIETSFDAKIKSEYKKIADKIFGCKDMIINYHSPRFGFPKICISLGLSSNARYVEGLSDKFFYLLQSTFPELHITGAVTSAYFSPNFNGVSRLTSNLSQIADYVNQINDKTIGFHFDTPFHFDGEATTIEDFIESLGIKQQMTKPQIKKSESTIAEKLRQEVASRLANRSQNG